MALANVKYTDREFQAIRQSLRDWIKTRFPKDWREILESPITSAYLDVVAYTHEQRAFYYNMQARNCYLSTAELPEAVLAIAKQLGYKRRLASAASAPVAMYPTPPQPTPILVEKGTKLAVDDLLFEAAESYTIPANKTLWPDDTTDELVVFVEGETKTEEFVSDGLAFQAFRLSNSNILQGSLEVAILDELWEETASLIQIEGTGFSHDVFVGEGGDNQAFKLSLLHVLIDANDDDVLVVRVNGEQWLRVDTFSSAANEYKVTQTEDGATHIVFGFEADFSAPVVGAAIDALYQIVGAQKRYTTDQSTSSHIVLHFGDGDGGLIPPSGATIQVAYRIGGGIKGNIPRGRMDDSIRGKLESGAGTTIRVINTQPASGGEEIESLDRIKQLAPVYAQANQRAVRKSDWMVYAMTYTDPRYGAVAFAAVSLKSQVPEQNIVQVAVWSRDELGRVHTASNPLKIGLKAHLDSKRTITTVVEIVDGDILYFEVKAAVLLQEGTSLASIQAQMTTVLRDHFNSAFVAPGADLALSLIIDKILSVPKVDQTVIDYVQGSKLLTLDVGTGDGVVTTYTGYFSVPNGLTLMPGTFEITDQTQTVNDDDNGVLTGDFDESGTNELNRNGKFVITFTLPPAANALVTAEARVYAKLELEDAYKVEDALLDGQLDYAPVVSEAPLGIADGQLVNTFLPQNTLPFLKNRLVFIGGWDKDGTQTGGQLLAYDDGQGNIIGDVVSGGIDYNTGEVLFSWNTLPPPSTTTDYWGYLSPVPDGVIKTFDFSVRTASGGGGTEVNLKTAEAIGRLKFLVSELNTPNVTYEDCWDNAQGVINGEAVDNYETNSITYEDPDTLVSKGTITFAVAPDPAGGRDFRVQKAPVTLFLNAPFLAYILDAGTYTKMIFADNQGHAHGDVSTLYPYSYLDLQSGRYKIDVASPRVDGRQMVVKYTSFMRSNNKDIPIDATAMSTFSRALLTETPREVNV